MSASIILAIMDLDPAKTPADFPSYCVREKTTVLSTAVLI